MALLKSGTRIYGFGTVDGLLTVGSIATSNSTPLVISSSITRSSSNTTGTIVITNGGGLATRGNIYSGNIVITGAVNSNGITFTDGTRQTRSGLEKGNTLTQTVVGPVIFNDGEPSTSNTTGTLVVTGGVGVSGNIYVGGTNAGANGIYTDNLRYAANGLPWVMNSGSGGGGGGGTGTGNANTFGWLANTIIVANSTGYLSNSNSFFVASNNAIVVPNVVITQAATASFPLSFGQGLGNKIGLWDGGGGTGYGFGIQNGKLQVFHNGVTDHTSFGYGGSSSFVEQFRVAGVVSSVNYLQVTGAATANSPILSAQGSSANVAINLIPKGNAAVMITGNTTGIIAAANSIYVGDRVGYANANNISVVYQSYNASTNSLDVVFG